MTEKMKDPRSRIAQLAKKYQIRETHYAGKTKAKITKQWIEKSYREDLAELKKMGSPLLDKLTNSAQRKPPFWLGHCKTFKVKGRTNLIKLVCENTEVKLKTLANILGKKIHVKQQATHPGRTEPEHVRTQNRRSPKMSSTPIPHLPAPVSPSPRNKRRRSDSNLDISVPSDQGNVTKKLRLKTKIRELWRKTATELKNSSKEEYICLANKLTDTKSPITPILADILLKMDPAEEDRPRSWAVLDNLMKLAGALKLFMRPH